jgi:hypothetical protein
MREADTLRETYFSGSGEEIHPNKCKWPGALGEALDSLVCAQIRENITYFS